jgi:hypothetical protein
MEWLSLLTIIRGAFISLVRRISGYWQGNMEERTESWLVASNLVFRRFVRGELTAD